jgi:nucleolar pre-ribosomal-associated protein 1
MTPTPIKLSLLEQHRDVFLLLFKGIFQDPYHVARHILEVCWEGVWCDPKIKRTLKIGLFNEITLNHLLKLYDRNEPEDGTTDHVPADLIHHFMLAVMTRPGVGICFKSRGWYPRDNSLDENMERNADLDVENEPVKGQGGKIYNKILANVVKGLKVNEDARQQELTFKILEACPELVAGSAAPLYETIYLMMINLVVTGRQLI